MNVVRANQAGVPAERRFTFFDQIHTTGIDIHQCIDARAALTLGKDMSFRDYAQGAYRMRGIGKGQTIILFIIPEVMKLIKDKVQQLNIARSAQTPALSVKPAAQGYGGDLLAISPGSNATMLGQRLLVDVTAWLTINGMKSENMQ